MGVLHQFGGFAENRCFLRKHLSGMRTKSMVHRGWIECVVGGAVAANQWDNELHPTPQGFINVAGRFAAALQTRFGARAAPPRRPRIYAFGIGSAPRSSRDDDCPCLASGLVVMASETSARPIAVVGTSRSRKAYCAAAANGSLCAKAPCRPDTATPVKTAQAIKMSVAAEGAAIGGATVIVSPPHRSSRPFDALFGPSPL